MIVPQKWTPHPYQKKAVKWLVSRAAAALFLDPGLGKTSATLAAFSLLKKRKMAERMLVVAPLRPCYVVWPTEIQKWADFRHLKVGVYHGTKRQKMSVLADDSLDIVVVNPEGLRSLTEADSVRTDGRRTKVLVDKRRFNNLGFDTLAIDEISKFKNGRSQRWKILRSVMDTFARRWGLTGTPAPNGLLDLWAQLYLLDGGRSLGPYFTKFRSQYFIPAAEFLWVPHDGAEQDIGDAINDIALRMAADDYLTLPQLVETNVTVQLPTKAARAYAEMETMLMTLFDNSKLAAGSATAASGKCRQIASGAVYDNEDPDGVEDAGRLSMKRTWTVIHDEKINAAKEIVNELQGQQVLLAYEYQHERTRLCEAFDAPAIGMGSTSRDTDLIDSWNAGRLPVLIAHPAALGHGVNLQGSNAHHIVWVTTTWDLELYEQFIARLRRQGSAASYVFVYRIIAEGTIDHAVIGALKRKDKTQQGLFQILKDHLNKRKSKNVLP